MVNIPKRLQEPEFKFILIKPKSKIPFEKEWQKTSNYSYDNLKLIEHLQAGGNYGVLCGENGLIVVDADTRDIEEAIKELPETFSVKSGSGGKHFYYKSNYNNKVVLIKDNVHYGEIQGKGSQVIGAGCIHPNGNSYEIINDTSIKEISEDDIKKVFGKYFVTENKSKRKNTAETDNELEEIKRRVKVPDVINYLGFDTSKNPTECLWHGSQGKANFGYDDETWHCFHCGKKGNIFHLVMEHENLLFNEAKNRIKEMFPSINLKDKKLDDSKKASRFILDKKELYELKSFHMGLIGDVFYYGIPFRYWYEITDKKGNVHGKEQRIGHGLVTSEKTIIDLANQRIKEDYKITFTNLPNSYPEKWDLDFIKMFLEGNYPEVKPLELYQKILEQYEKYIYVNDECWWKFGALWDIGTYLFELFDYYPIRELMGFMETAKTKTMKISAYTSFNSPSIEPIEINPSESTLFRDTNDFHYAKYIDEAENLFKWTKFGLEHDSRIELINASFQKGGAVKRTERIDGKFRTIPYSVYSPTCIGSIKGLLGSTESRAITQITIKNPKGDLRGKKEPNPKDKIWREIISDCYVFGLSYHKQIKDIYDTIEVSEIDSRDFNKWKPILTIAKFINEGLFEEMKIFAIKISKTSKLNQMDENSTEYKIAKWIIERFKNEGEPSSIRFYVKDLVEGIYPDSENRPKNNSFITRIIDRFGFKDDKSRDKTSTYYELNWIKFSSIISSQIPSLDLSTSSTSST